MFVFKKNVCKDNNFWSVNKLVIGQRLLVIHKGFEIKSGTIKNLADREKNQQLTADGFIIPIKNRVVCCQISKESPSIFTKLRAKNRLIL